jgi:hypothetical protein
MRIVEDNAGGASSAPHHSQPGKGTAGAAFALSESCLCTDPLHPVTALNASAIHVTCLLK